MPPIVPASSCGARRARLKHHHNGCSICQNLGQWKHQDRCQANDSVCMPQTIPQWCYLVQLCRLPGTNTIGCPVPSAITASGHKTTQSVFKHPDFWSTENPLPGSGFPPPDSLHISHEACMQPPAASKQTDIHASRCLKPLVYNGARPSPSQRERPLAGSCLFEHGRLTGHWLPLGK